MYTLTEDISYLGQNITYWGHYLQMNGLMGVDPCDIVRFVSCWHIFAVFQWDFHWGRTNSTQYNLPQAAFKSTHWRLGGGGGGWVGVQDGYMEWLILQCAVARYKISFWKHKEKIVKWKSKYV